MTGIVPRELGDEARALPWRRIGLSRDDPPGWTRPVVWTADLTGEGPFGAFMSSGRLHAAQEHRGAEPRFTAQLPITLTTPLTPGDATLSPGRPAGDSGASCPAAAL